MTNKLPCICCARPTIHRINGQPACAAAGRCAARADDARQAEHIEGDQRSLPSWA